MSANPLMRTTSACGALPRRARSGKQALRQRGVTLVELMVALVIGLVITLAAVASLLTARSGFTATDASAQVRENARFAADLIYRIANQAGYEDVAYGVGTRSSAMFGGVTPPPDLDGYDDALFGAQTTFPPTLVGGSRTSDCTATDTSCLNGSDILVLRYQGSSTPPTSATGDGSIINCAGKAEPSPTGVADDRAYSVFHVARGTNGEPALMCSYRSGSTWVTEPIVQGVEGFQVLYGVDYNNGASTGQDSVADRYLRASQIVVAGNPTATETNWRHVRSLRIGLLVRGPLNSAVDRTATGRTYYPLGVDQSASADTGTALSVTADGRLRQELSFTVYLHNKLGND
jgi:type IV pilus assembly protein PilW